MASPDARRRPGELAKNKTVYVSGEVTCAGRKEVLVWIEQTEGARFWFAVINELKARAGGTLRRMRLVASGVTVPRF